MYNKALLKENTFLHGISSTYQYMSKIESLCIKQENIL